MKYKNPRPWGGASEAVGGASEAVGGASKPLPRLQDELSAGFLGLLKHLLPFSKYKIHTF